MTATLIISGSPSTTSRTTALAKFVGKRLAQFHVDSSFLDLRSLPPEDLIFAHADAPPIVAAVERLAAARGVVIATPVYKAAYSGLLKTFLDLLPQFGLREKVVLPLVTGGTPAHVLAIDYALRPVLHSLDPLHIVPGLFVLDKQITLDAEGNATLEEDVANKLDGAISALVNGLRRAAHQLID
ncbi:MAG TPA: NADPH-dependent FMN reductase [Polyangiales bacterium]|jgi:FMN reductase|nr:NADPH-dependent FMN reductase [Polyangiales bacterium]